MPTCARCGGSDFGTRNRCNTCRARDARAEWAANPVVARESSRVRAKRWRAENPEKVQAQDRLRRYAITADEVRTLAKKQDGRCAICGEAEPGCVDHCHETGAVRGLLCRRCNAGLGQFRDDPALLARAIAYLAASRQGA